MQSPIESVESRVGLGLLAKQINLMVEIEERGEGARSALHGD